MKVRPISVDLISDQIECSNPDYIVPVDRIKIEGFDEIAYPVFPVERAIAEKYCGIMEGRGGQSSSRVKDLVDIVIYGLTESFDNQKLSYALTRELKVREIPSRESFVLPEEWIGKLEPNYRRLTESLNIPAKYLDMHEAEKLAIKLFDLPLRNPSVEATWNKDLLAWLIFTE